MVGATVHHIPWLNWNWRREDLAACDGGSISNMPGGLELVAEAKRRWAGRSQSAHMRRRGLVEHPAVEDQVGGWFGVRTWSVPSSGPRIPGA